MKVFVITKGSYSDYHICGVATDEEKAEKMAKFYTDRCDDANVEVYDTEEDASEIDAFDASRLPYMVTFDYLGDVINADRTDVKDFIPGVRWRSPASSTRFRDVALFVDLYAPDREAAIKIAAEKRAEFLAQKEGLT